MASACFDKCVSNFRVKALDIEELSCLDRCAFKYWTTHESINGEMKRQNDNIALRDQISEENQQWTNSVQGPK